MPRTTLTLDDDVAALLARVQRQRKGSFKQIVNDALRRGLQPDAAPGRRRPYHTPSVDFGRCNLANLDDVAEALSIAEGESFR